ncbi:MAG: hypothetical protein Q8O57_07745, partial [Kiritimatiellota bacterium]|nr:hypothetical protein [Kiritimatiellota bacterium]
ELQTRTAENLRNANVYCEWSAIVLLVARGDLQTKRERLRYWQELCSLNPDVGERLRRLAKGEAVSNPLLFLFLWIQQYVSLRLMDSAQPMPPSGPIQLELPQHYEVPLSQELWHRLLNHPLTASRIYLEGITRE